MTRRNFALFESGRPLNPGANPLKFRSFRVAAPIDLESFEESMRQVFQIPLRFFAGILQGIGEFFLP